MFYLLRFVSPKFNYQMIEYRVTHLVINYPPIYHICTISTSQSRCFNQAECLYRRIHQFSGAQQPWKLWGAVLQSIRHKGHCGSAHYRRGAEVRWRDMEWGSSRIITYSPKYHFHSQWRNHDRGSVRTVRHQGGTQSS